MENTLKNYKGQEFELKLHYAHKFNGRGSWNVECEVAFKCEKKTFTKFTTNSQFIAYLLDLRAEDASHETIQKAYHDFAFSDLEEQILEWADRD